MDRIRCQTPGCRGIPRNSMALGPGTYCERCAWARQDAMVAAETARREQVWGRCTECGNLINTEDYPDLLQCGFKCRTAARRRAAV